MLSQDFCADLEFALTRAFTNATEEPAKGFWCDGVLLSESEKEISIKNINDKRQVLMTAFIGKDGQDKYDLILNFGDRSLSKYASGLDITECIPDIVADNWYEIDAVKKKITVWLL